MTFHLQLNHHKNHGQKLVLDLHFRKHLKKTLTYLSPLHPFQSRIGKVTVVVIKPTLTLVMEIEVLVGLIQLKIPLWYQKFLKQFLLNQCTAYIESVQFKEVLY